MLFGAMKLIEVLAGLVPKRIIARGESYYFARKVKLADPAPGLIQAIVSGSVDYAVEVFLGVEKTVNFECSCPYFLDRMEICKHIWATLLAADAARQLPDWPHRNPPDLIPMDGDDDFDEHSEDEDDFDDLDPDFDEEEAEVEDPYDRYRPRAEIGESRHRRWKEIINSLRLEVPRQEKVIEWPEGRQLHYVLRLNSWNGPSDVTIAIESRDLKKNGELGKPKVMTLDHTVVSLIPDPTDRELLRSIVGIPSYAYPEARSSKFYPSMAVLKFLLPMMCGTGRCFFSPPDNEKSYIPLQWDPGDPWEFNLELLPGESSSKYLLSGYLVRNGHRISLEEPTILFREGLVILNGFIGPLNYKGAFGWIGILRKEKALTIPAAQAAGLVKELLDFPALPKIDLPAELSITEVVTQPQPRLKIRKSRGTYEGDILSAALSFIYEGYEILESDTAAAIAEPERRRRILRNREAESAAERQLLAAGFRKSPYYYGDGWQVARRLMPSAVLELTAAGWRVEAEGKLVRHAGSFKIEVTSGIDWFEVRGSVEFDDKAAPLPALLAAVEKQDRLVVLDDGSFGILPEEWLDKYGLLTGLAEKKKDHLRFSRGQAGLLDALLAAEPDVSCDEVFESARRKLRQFEGVAPADPAPGFCGTLREYQREGLGWLHFLREFGFGGCLADDMGLGKTVQVLALLETRRAEAAGPNGGTTRPPSIAVVPRSLIFNWKEEAARFTPQLKVLDHTGGGRAKQNHNFSGYDLVLTTYGTLRRDASSLKALHFDYVILDEAQAIKNADSASAKAARLLKGNHRLALSGTPVENHLGELWSIFEFLNPGMLGSSALFKLAKGALRNPDAQTRDLLARGLRSFILRRTKSQVATDLPAKVEQTLYCELDKPQRTLYDELRDHYRHILLNRVDREGISRSKFQILEALLRLRQAAIHPGLVDKSRTGETSAKLEALLPQLEEVIQEEHKVLVFSQFTSMLAIVRDRLDQAGTPYVYLDGQTRDRAAVVDQFQNDERIPLFLISLKAGGLGLNLTAAEYVFLLDPWWNPAVEMQAIDRTHRIGQTRSVFAYRLIARDTVEEKVLELQKSKRELADAIINADNSLIRDLKQEDLALLLS